MECNNCGHALETDELDHRHSSQMSSDDYWGSKTLIEIYRSCGACPSCGTMVYHENTTEYELSLESEEYIDEEEYIAARRSG